MRVRSVGGPLTRALLWLATGCAVVPGRAVDALLDPDGDGWTSDVDCDNHDPLLGGGEYADNGFDDDCDGLAVFDLRTWSLGDGTCWIRGEAGGALLIGDGVVTDALGERSGTGVATEDLDGDGLPELLRLDGVALSLEPSAGGTGLALTLPDAPIGVRWGGQVAGCPTALLLAPDPVQPVWHTARRVELCAGTELASWSWSGADRSLTDLQVIPTDADRWPDLVVARPDRDLPDVSILGLEPTNPGAPHDVFDVRLLGSGAPFGAHTATGDLDGDGGIDLAVSAPDGVWIVRGEALSAGPQDVADVGQLVPTEPVRGLTFQDLDQDGRDAVIVAIDGIGGPRLLGFDAQGVQVAYGAAPAGTCDDALTLADGVLVMGGRAWALPGLPAFR